MANAFQIKKHDPNLTKKPFDKYYIDVKLVDSVKKIGEGDEDYIIVKKEVISKRDIDEVIESQAADVGLEAALKKFSLTGDPSVLPEPLPEDGALYDVTQLPQDLMDADNYFKAMKAKFDALPDDLKNGRDFNAFMSTITQQQFDAYIASLQPKKEVKEGDAK